MLCGGGGGGVRAAVHRSSDYPARERKNGKSMDPQ